jgi:hypothetical protein
MLADGLADAAAPIRFDRVGRVDDHLAREPVPVLGDELLEGIKPDGENEHIGPVDRLIDAHHLGVAVEVGRDLAGGLLVAAGDQEVQASGREVRREPAADVAGADDGNRAIRDGHCGPPFVTWFPVEGETVDQERVSPKLVAITVIGCRLVRVIRSLE